MAESSLIRAIVALSLAHALPLRRAFSPEQRRQAIAERIDTDAEIHLTLEPQDGEALAWLYEHGRITERSSDPEGRTLLTVRLSEPALGRYQRLFTA